MKYNAKTINQEKFGERLEEEFGFICDFTFYGITRGKGNSLSNGCCSSSLVCDYNGKRYNLLLYYPLKKYLNKNKYLSAGIDKPTIHLEIEDREPKERICKYI